MSRGAGYQPVPAGKNTGLWPVPQKRIMSIKVRIPSPLRSFADGADQLEFEGTTVDQIIAGFLDKAPGARPRLFKQPGQLNRFVNLYLNDEDIRHLDNLATPVKDGDVISIVPAIAGGAPQR